ncbi:succinate dehydrogenase, hydrophobic membrane anchor protein [Rickettsiella grylli]|uniref:succinate dehydrogenase, hydrophobic membrane anchor protein n=1 Tax=Rickettsiella grylli TaxID=59196 RepID=UPI0008FD0E47|nr:succinate dehydrogenase, hydrophobic membrane anchor protein [Rickettsiella grylli]OIZ98160.1 succinate dehydrogenase, hydrophobic membrane anchor protein [Rickettsiella grylli]
MVKNLTNITSLSGNGLRDWLIQRVTSLVLAAYILFLLAYIGYHHPLDFTTWQHLFSHLSMRLFSTLFLFSLFWHAWVGLWTIVTDYIRWASLRLMVQLFIIMTLFLYLIWGLAIFWGVIDGFTHIHI